LAVFGQVSSYLASDGENENSQKWRSNRRLDKIKLPLERARRDQFIGLTKM
jgi:hypothetical protein